MPKTKIIATIGPASANPHVMRKMIKSGLDGVRFNFSHGSFPEYLKNLALVRGLNKKLLRAVKTIGDLKGNRIRVRNIAKDLELRKKQTIVITKKNIKSVNETISFDYTGSLSPVKKGHKIYIDDGKIELEVLAVSKDYLKTAVLIGGILKNRKGVNMPDSRLDFPLLSEEDREDLVFAVKHKFDYIAHSFVRSAADIKAVRKIIEAGKSKAKIIAKIENREALENLAEIINASDGIMVARGDLGISVPIYEIPVLQKKIVADAKKAGKFVIVATQMMESMTENYLPTRAEVTDVANAIYDGADMVMLSGETAAGKYPVECVRMMNEVIKYSEKYMKLYAR